ncbi:MAG TPA: hypothetical protein VM687_12500 [Stenotrophomonas sp.]|nr:hypothetical protein [Stenotrophomonas sp.]
MLLMGGLVLALILPIFLARTRQARGRLLGMLVGGYFMVVGGLAAVGLLYLAIIEGRTGIVRNRPSTVFVFAENPVVASVSLLVSLVCAGMLAYWGLSLFRGARNGTLGA